MDWCNLNNLELNVSKTKELVMDIRKKKVDHSPLLINNIQIQQVEYHRFLGFWNF